jgi:dTMP kinase
MTKCLISFEGNDGSGKSTAAKHLHDWLKKEGYKPELFREPGSTMLGEELRNLLVKEAVSLCEEAELFLFQAARIQLIKEKIKPALAAGKLVILDRFYDSTWVYQGYCQGLRLVDVEFCNRLATAYMEPAITFFLDTPPALCLERIKQRGKASKDELDINWLTKIHEGYHELAKLHPKRIRRINGEQPISAIDTLIQQEVLKLKENL